MAELSYDQKKQMAQDLMKDLMVWREDMQGIQKRFDSLEERVYNLFGGHLIKGYVDGLSNRISKVWNILDGVLNEE